MNSIFSRCIYPAITITVIIAALDPSSVQARGRRGRFVQPLPCVPCTPCADDRVCPQYIWMNHGSYYSFYALKCTETMTPVSYDSSLPTTYLGCSSDCPFLVALTATEVEQSGYGNSDTDIAQSLQAGEIPGGDTNRLVISPETTIFVSFTPEKGKKIFAQIWKAKISPKASSGGFVEFTRGTQVLSVPPGAKVYPVTSTNSNGLMISPALGKAHTYTLSCDKDSPMGACRVSIVSHRSAPGHTLR